MKKALAASLIFIFSAGMLFAADTAASSEKTAKQYIEDLSSADEAAVLIAEDQLGQKKEKDAVTKLLDLLKTDKRVKVRMNAAVALGLIGEKSAAEPISEAILSEQSADVRYASVLALSRIGIDSQKAVDNLFAARDKETDPFIKDFVTKLEEKFRNK